MTEEQKQQREIEAKLARSLTDKGLLIEAGWLSFKIMCVPATADALQIKDMRTSFFAGAQHLFGCACEMVEGGAEPTDNDMNRMSNVDAELRRFAAELKLEVELKQHRN